MSQERPDRLYCVFQWRADLDDYALAGAAMTVEEANQLAAAQQARDVDRKPCEVRYVELFWDAEPIEQREAGT